MCTNVGDADSRLRIRVKDVLDEIFAFGGQELGHSVICGHDLLVQIRRLRVLKRKIPGHHGVKYDTAGPDIGLEAVIALSSDHLRNKKEGN